MLNIFNYKSQASALEKNKRLCHVVTDLLWTDEISTERKTKGLKQLRAGILENNHGVELANEMTFLIHVLEKKKVCGSKGAK